MDRPQLTSALDPPRAVYGSIAGVAGDRFSHAGNVPTHGLAQRTSPPREAMCQARTVLGSTSELLRCYRKHQRASPMPQDSPQSPAWTAWTPFEASA